KKGIKGSILVGLSLGPVFSSCSPTYGIILSIVLPVSYVVGVINLGAYVLGLSVVMLAVALLGQKFISKAKWATDPNGLFKKILGVLFILVGLAIMFGWDKQIESHIIEKGYIGVGELENKFLDKIEIPKK
ncbi:MAG: cytochrome C biogenesis protein, partial [Candidatus Gracilibacteria bacterium]|nr:cytochrome C biogenesis protein [Candidatus Gracilibacteria bacterium]